MRVLPLLALVPAVLDGQERAAGCRAPHTPDSLTVRVTARLQFQDTTMALPAADAGFFLEEFRRQLRLPAPLALSTYVAPDSIDGVANRPRRAYAIFRGVYVVTRDDGTVKPGLQVSSGVPAVDRAVLDAIAAAHAAHAIPRVRATASGTTSRLQLRLTSEASRSDHTPLFRLRVPMSTLSKEVALLSGPHSGLGFPEPLRRAGVEGDALLAFVVGPDGRVVEGSVDVVRTDHHLFAQEAIGVLPKMRYSPARIGECAVPVVVVQLFGFKFRGPPP